MTTLTLAVSRPLFGGIVRFLSALAGGIRDGRRLAARYDALSRLSDAELARRGLDRATLPQAVARGC
jgi:hypothetical protein